MGYNKTPVCVVEVKSVVGDCGSGGSGLCIDGTNACSIIGIYGGFICSLIFTLLFRM